MRAAILFSLIAAQAAAGDFVSISRKGNLYTVQATDGSVELEWISTSAFRFSRRWGRVPASRPLNKEAVEVVQGDRGPDIRFDTQDLSVVVEKGGLRLRVRDTKGKLLLYDSGPMIRTAAGISVERLAVPAEQFYGLGPRTDAAYDARGSVIVAARPFLMSSLGYGLHHTRAGEYTFDLAKADPRAYKISLRGGQRFEFFFYLGATHKAILEEHLPVEGSLEWKVQDFEVQPPSRVPGYAWRLPREWNLCESAAAIGHASMSGMVAPALDLDRHAGPRADRLASVVPILYGTKPWRTPRLRRSLQPFLYTYLQEARDRGFPVLRGVPFQYPGDQEALRRTDEFMLGDEILVAPLCGESNSRTVYLPRGNWTDLDTGQLHPGRQTVSLEAAPDTLPMFARNGSILPFAPVEVKGPMRLEYFPKLAAEFFIWEPDLEHITQVHAAPAADIYRFEIESLKDRVYEWVLHHTDRPKQVMEVPGKAYLEVQSQGELKPGCWFYDATLRRLHFRVESLAGGDEIVNVTY